VPLQEWIHHWEVGAGARIVRSMAAVLAFIAVAGLYDLLAFQSFSSEEAMETAQLARNISQGAGFTTKTLRPLSIYLLNGKASQEAAPDITNPPVYPVLLAGLMKVAPVRFTATQYWSYQPERWIAVFNQALFFAAIVLLFRIARKLFDDRVAWLSALLFGGTSLFWKFSASGLSTSWVVVVFLAVVLCLAKLAEETSAGPPSVGWSALAGALAGVAGLSRYSLGWMIVPVLLFLALGARGPRGKHCAACAICFLVLLGPWLARNVELTATPFGTASYAVIQDTPTLEGESLERSLDPRLAIRRVGLMDVVDKFLANGRDLWRNDLPRFGGNWASAFFLVGLLMPFQNPTRGRIRLFLLGSIVLLFIVQALGQTHLSKDSPEINTENLLIVLAPVTFIYGAALFFTLMDQLSLVTMDSRGVVIGVFLVGLSVPLLLSLLVATPPALNTPYSPLHIQRIAGLMGQGELMMSDIPAGVAWYGDHDCAWLSLDDDREFFKINKLRRVQAVFLTQRTTEDHFLSQMSTNPKSWGHLFFECESHFEFSGYGEVPSGFPLTHAPSGFLPDQLLLSDKVRWGMPSQAEK
jgi:4-amino-4-deoxy-L-arabinose transferase-like glycosyltransferase